MAQDHATDVNGEEDEVQDWKIFSSVVGGGQDIVPKRGDKDFEPEGTDIQASLLQESKDAMFQALEVVRGYSEKQEVIAVWFPDRLEAYVPSLKGPYFKDCGRSDNFGHVKGAWLYAWEALYLCERGSMRVYLSSPEYEEWLYGLRSPFQDAIVEEFDYSSKLTALSLSFFYSFMNAEILDKYLVYAYLKRLGYLVMPFKPSDWKSYMETLAAPKRQNLGIQMIFQNIFNYIGETVFPSYLSGKSMGLLPKRHYFDYNSIYRDIHLIPAYSTYDSVKESGSFTSSPAVEPHFDVWKPTPNFSKKAPVCPDFQIIIYNTQFGNFPSLENIQKLFNVSKLPVESKRQEIKTNTKASMKKKDKPLTKKELRQARQKDRISKLDEIAQARIQYLKQRSQKWKFGARNFTLAMIDNGVLNFVTLAEGDFSLKGYGVDELDLLNVTSIHGLVKLD